jgi:hypothetical protein
VWFTVCLKFGLYSNFQYGAIVLGVATVLAVNPIEVFFPRLLPGIFTSIASASFLAFFRLFTIYVLDSILHASEAFFTPWTFFYAPLIIVYACVEGFADITHAHGRIADGLCLLHLIYCFGTLVFLAYAFTVSLGLAHFKIAVFSLFLLPPIGATLLTEIFMKWVGTGYVSFSLMVYQSFHIVSAIAILFFLHSAKAGKFEAGGKEKKCADQEIAINVSPLPQ